MTMSIQFIIAVLASFVGGLVFWLLQKYLGKYKRTKTEAEEQLRLQLEKYESASSTVGARTDLGFYLVNELANYRFFSLVSLVIALGEFLASIGFIILMALALAAGLLELAAIYTIAALVFIILSVTTLYSGRKHIELWGSHSAKFKEIWGSRIEQHAK